MRDTKHCDVSVCTISALDSCLFHRFTLSNEIKKIDFSNSSSWCNKHLQIATPFEKNYGKFKNVAFYLDLPFITLIYLFCVCFE